MVIYSANETKKIVTQSRMRNTIGFIRLKAYFIVTVDFLTASRGSLIINDRLLINHDSQKSTTTIKLRIRICF